MDECVLVTVNDRVLSYDVNFLILIVTLIIMEVIKEQYAGRWLTDDGFGETVKELYTECFGSD